MNTYRVIYNNPQAQDLIIKADDYHINERKHAVFYKKVDKPDPNGYEVITGCPNVRRVVEL